MATKKPADTKPSSSEVANGGSGDRAKDTIQERVDRKRDAATVDGSESFPPPGMDLPDGGQVPLSEDESA